MDKSLESIRRYICNLICQSHYFSPPTSKILPSPKILIPVSEVPRGVYHPKKHTDLTTPSSLPPFSATDQDYDNFLRKTKWGDKLINSLVSFDKGAVENGEYCKIHAKDLVIGYYRAPKLFRCSIIDALIANRIIVASIDESSYPANWNIPRQKKVQEQHFSSPLVAVQPQPLDPDIVYVFTDASYHKDTQYSGLGYVICHDQTIVDEGHSVGSQGESSHVGEVESINLGVHAAYVYLSSLSMEDLKKVKVICLCNDSTSAIGHSFGSSKIHKLNAATIDAVWDTYQMMECFDVFHYQHIPRELNGAADLLAQYSCDLQVNGKAKAFDGLLYKRFCEDMIARNVFVGFKAVTKKAVVC